MNSKCEICKVETKLMYSDYPGYKADLKFDIHFCSICLTSFSLPRVDATNLYNFIYKNSMKVPGYSRYFNYYQNIKSKSDPLKYLTDSEEAYWGVAEVLKNTVKSKKSASILEIGSGLGYLTYALRKGNFNIIGLDISKEAVSQANSYFGNYYVCADLFEYVKSKSNFFDYVILTEVIEHVEDPVAFIKAIKKMLKVDGRIILTTPNKSIAPNDVIWDSESPPIHHWWFSEKSIKYMASSLNLSTSFVDFSKYYRRYPGEYRYINKLKNQLRSPLIDGKWNLIIESNKKKASYLKLAYKKLLKSILLLTSTVKIIYLKVKRVVIPSTIIYGQRGKILCAVLRKE